MSFSASIMASIGADVKPMQQAGSEVERLAGRMNSALGQIGVGLSFGAVLGFFSKVVDHAGSVQDLSDRLGVGTDALQAFEYRASQAGVQADAVAGLWDKAAKSISQLTAGQKAAADDIINRFDGISTNWDAMAEKAVTSGEKQVTAITKVMAKSGDLARMEREQFDRTVALLPVKERINALEESAVELRRQAANAGQNTVEWAEKEARARQLFAEATKLAAEETKRLGDIEAEYYRKSVALDEKLRDQKRAAMSDADRIIAIEKDIAGWKKQQVGLDKESNEYKALQVKINDANKQVEEARTNIAKGTLAAEKAITEQKQLQIFITRTGRDNKDLSPAELAKKIDTLEADIARRQAANPFGNDFLLAPQRQNLAEALAEQDLRRRTLRNIDFFGEERAFQMFGDSEARFNDIKNGRDTSTNGRVADALEKLNKRLDEGVRTVLIGDGS